MQKHISPKVIALTFGILTISFLAAFYVVAWQEPTQAPPGGNVPTPLNIGSTGQLKTGWLATLRSFFIGSEPSEDEKGTAGVLRTTGGAILNTGGAGTGLIVQSGNVGIGATNPQAKLEVAGNAIVSTPTANTHAATKGYVDAQVGTKGLPTFVVRNTSASYKGNLGGRNGANDKCQTEFGGGAVMFGTQHVNCYTAGTCILEYRVTSASWFDTTDNVQRYDGRNANKLEGWASPFNCNGWSSTGGCGDVGGYEGSSSWIVCDPCETEKKVACAIQK